MADTWRRQTLASWDVLLDFDHATIATYAYLATGPASTKTGCVRIHKRRLRRELSLKGTQVDAVLADLAVEGLIVVSEARSVLTIYLAGTIANCPPKTPNTRRGYAKDLVALGDCDATRAALADLSLSGETDPQLIELTGAAKRRIVECSSTHGRETRSDQIRLDQSRVDLLAQAPTPSAPETVEPSLKTREILALVSDEPTKPKKPDPVVAVVRAYLDTCATVGMPKVRVDENGMPSPAIAAAVRKAIKANGHGYDWQAYFRQASRGAHLRGENDRRWRASIAWLCKPANAAKVESGQYGDTAPPTAILAPVRTNNDPAGELPDGWTYG